VIDAQGITRKRPVSSAHLPAHQRASDISDEALEERRRENADDPRERRGKAGHSAKIQVIAWHLLISSTLNRAIHVPGARATARWSSEGSNADARSTNSPGERRATWGGWGWGF